MSEKAKTSVGHGHEDSDVPSDVEVTEIIRQASESSNIHFYNHPCVIEVPKDKEGNYHTAKRRFGLTEIKEVTNKKATSVQYRGDNSPLVKMLQPHSAMLSGDFMESSIAEFCLSLEQICSKAAIRGQTVIPIYIDSYGGDVYSMLKVLDTLDSLRQAYDVKFATIAQGKAMSAGAFLLMSGDIGYRYATPRATVMVHDVSTEMGGRLSELQTSYKEVERLSSAVMSSLSLHVTGGKNPNHIQELLAKIKHTDLYLSALDAKNVGLVDYVGIPTFKFEISLKEEIIPLEQEGFTTIS